MNPRSDTLYKQLFAHPEIVRDLVAGFLSADWAQTLDISAFERAAIDAFALRIRQADMEFAPLLRDG